MGCFIQYPNLLLGVHVRIGIFFLSMEQLPQVEFTRLLPCRLVLKRVGTCIAQMTTLVTCRFFACNWSIFSSNSSASKFIPESILSFSKIAKLRFCCDRSSWIMVLLHSSAFYGNIRKERKKINPLSQDQSFAWRSCERTAYCKFSEQLHTLYYS